MADIRINALATTAASTASDDFVAVDGSANGTRKLNAFSPTFGGNLTVSGSATIGAGLTSNGDPGLQVNATSSIGRVVFSRTAGTLQSWQVGTTGNDATAIAFNIDDNTVGATRFKIAATTGLVTIGQNLTVSGTGTNTFTGDVYVTRTTGNPAFRLTNGSGGSFPIFQFVDQRVGGNNWNIEDGRVAGQLGFYSSNGGGTMAAITDTGNFLIGTTTDGGQKLQVAGTVAFTGDLYSPTAGSTWGADSGATGFLVYGAGGGANANKLVFRTNSTTALTLDNSQNATFAGNITVNGAGPYTLKSRTVINRSDNTSAAFGHLGLTRGTGAGIQAALQTTGDASNGVASVTINISDTDRFVVTSVGTVVLGTQAALATNATDGFTYIPVSAGAPTGTPTAYTGKVAMEYDTTNNKLYIYNGGWKSVTLA